MILNDNYANANMTRDCDHTCRTVESGKQNFDNNYYLTDNS